MNRNTEISKIRGLLSLYSAAFPTLGLGCFMTEIHYASRRPGLAGD